MLLAEVFLLTGLGYLTAGVLVGILFILCGVQRIDGSARGASLGFRLVILPGTVALWPALLWKWRQAPSTGGHA
jgi:hypothetical protein